MHFMKDFSWMLPYSSLTEDHQLENLAHHQFVCFQHKNMYILPNHLRKQTNPLKLKLLKVIESDNHSDFR